MLKIVTISLGRTLNVSDYESVRFELSVQVQESFEQTFKQLQKEVDALETRLRREYKKK